MVAKLWVGNPSRFCGGGIVKEPQGHYLGGFIDFNFCHWWKYQGRRIRRFISYFNQASKKTKLGFISKPLRCFAPCRTHVKALRRRRWGRSKGERSKKNGPNRELNPRPLAPKARITRLDHWAVDEVYTLLRPLAGLLVVFLVSCEATHDFEQRIPWLTLTMSADPWHDGGWIQKLGPI